MSDSVPTEQADLSSLTSSPGPKRKRELDSPGSQRAKRAIAAAAISPETAAFIADAIKSTHAAAANGVNVADFNALQQAAAADHTDASDPSNATSTAQAALGMYPTLIVPRSTEEQFAAEAAAEGDHHSEAAFNAEIAQPDMMDPSAVTQQPPASGGQSPAHRYSSSSAGSNPRPTVGSEEWHKMRKDNHKEVERRRREAINEGINELAKIVPGCGKNKGSILQRAVSFISQIQKNEQQNSENWTLQRLLTDQAITELSETNDKLKQECERVFREGEIARQEQERTLRRLETVSQEHERTLREIEAAKQKHERTFREMETWKRVAQDAGLKAPQPEEEPNPGASSS